MGTAGKGLATRLDRSLQSPMSATPPTRIPQSRKQGSLRRSGCRGCRQECTFFRRGSTCVEWRFGRGTVRSTSITIVFSTPHLPSTAAPTVPTNARVRCATAVQASETGALLRGFPQGSSGVRCDLEACVPREVLRCCVDAIDSLAHIRRKLACNRHSAVSVRRAHARYATRLTDRAQSRACGSGARQPRAG